MVTMTRNVHLIILITLLLLLTFSSTKTTTTFSCAFQLTNSMSLQRLRRSTITTTTTTLSSLSYSSTTVPPVSVGRLTTKRSSRLLLFRYSNDIRTKTFSKRRRNMMMTSSSSSFFTEASSSNNDENNDEEEEEVYTIESLRNYAQQLIRNNSLQHTNSYRYCFYLAGGGSLATSLVAATAGASSFLLEGRTTYNRFSYLNACTMSDSDTKGKSFSYGSRQAAILLSNSALKQALKLMSFDDNLIGMPLTIGVGCTSVLATTATTTTKSGNNDSINDGGRGNVVVTRADGIRLTVTIQMKAGRERFDEDLILSHLVLRSIELFMMYNDNDNDNEDENEEYNSNNNNNKEYITRAGDIVTEEWELSTTTTLSTTDDDASTTISMVGDNDIDSVIEDAARRVIDGGEDAVVLLPLYGSTPDNNNTTTDKKKQLVLPSTIRGIRALSQTVIPNNCLIFPGSFNPLHIGHLQLANASIRTLERLQPYIHPRNHNEKPILFELSLTNVDKPSIDPNIVISRIRKILELYASAAISNNNDTDTPKFPQQWGIVLTRAPLFEEKLNILRSKVLVADDDQSSKKINFVIGTDTLVRILNPKYYQDQLRINMNKSLLELKSNGVGFIIGGRLEQQKQSTSSSLQSSKASPPSPPSQPRFVSGRDELTDLPEDIASMFTVMEESEFRVDLSSSEIRKQQQQQQQQEEEQEKIVK